MKEINKSSFYLLCRQLRVAGIVHQSNSEADKFWGGNLGFIVCVDVLLKRCQIKKLLFIPFLFKRVREIARYLPRMLHALCTQLCASLQREHEFIDNKKKKMKTAV